MVRLLAGDKNVGVQGIYYFETKEEALSLGKSFKPFLDSLRFKDGKEAQKIMDNWRHERIIYNFFCKMKERVAEEKEHPEVWWEPGGKLYGEEWKNYDLPNGQGEAYLGEKRIFEENDIQHILNRTSTDNK